MILKPNRDGKLRRDESEMGNDKMFLITKWLLIYRLEIIFIMSRDRQKFLYMRAFFGMASFMFLLLSLCYCLPLLGDKLKILKVLVDQFLTYAATRDLIDDNYEKLRQVRLELKQLQWAEMRREREEAAAR